MAAPISQSIPTFPPWHPCVPCLCLCLYFCFASKIICTIFFLGFPDGSVVKNLPANAGDKGSIPGWRIFPGGGHGNPLQYPCQENSMDRGAWQGLQSIGSQGVRHDWAHTHTYTHTVFSRFHIYIYIYIYIHTHTYMHKNIYLFFSFWLSSLCVTVSRFLYS